MYASALPAEAVFLHKGDFYEKIDDEHAKQVRGKEWIFEGHYGCLISEEQFKVYDFTEKEIRVD